MTCKTCNRDTAVNSKNEEFCKGCGKIRNCPCSPLPDKISIIIPVYNAEKYINKAIGNALRQTYENFEVIVVDDGSTDKTLLNLERDPLSKNIKIIEKENGGVSSALNAGIKAMTGQWFKWLSADDELDIDCLKIMMEHIKEVKDSHEKIFYTNYDIINEDDELLDIVEEPNRNNLSYVEKCAHLLSNYYGNATTCMIHKSVFDQVGLFDETLKNGDDYDFWFRCLFGHRIELYLIEENLANYRRHSKQLTHRRGAELFKTVEQIRKKNLELLPQETRQEVIELTKTINKKPIKVRLRRKARNIIFSIMPNKVNNKILTTYQERKKE